MTPKRAGVSAVALTVLAVGVLLIMVMFAARSGPERIFAGPLGRDDIVAAPWRPGIELADSAGLVRPEFVWAALDCPGAFAFTTKRGIPLLLGRLTARLATRLSPGETATVLGWPIGRDGRKLFAGTAVFAASGALAGLARAVWFLPAGIESLE